MSKLISFDGTSGGSGKGLYPNFTGAPSNAQGIVAVWVPGVEGASFNTSVQYIHGKAGKIASTYIPRLTTAPPATGAYPGTSVNDLFGRALDAGNLNAIRALFDANYVVMQYLPSGSGLMLYFLYTPAIFYVPRFQVIDAVTIQLEQKVSLAIWVGTGCEYVLISPLVYTITSCSSPIAPPPGGGGLAS